MDGRHHQKYKTGQMYKLERFGLDVRDETA